MTFPLLPPLSPNLAPGRYFHCRSQKWWRLEAYISASWRASSVIDKAKAEAWQTICSSLLPKYDPKSVHSLLRSVAGSSSSSSSSPNFPNCFSPREAASVFTDYLRSHFSVSQPKTLRSRARGNLTQLRRATCSEESHSIFLLTLLPHWISCDRLQPLHVHWNWPRQSCLSQAKASSSLWHGFSSSHFRSFLDFAFLPSIWKTSFIIPIHKMGKPLDYLASFQPISLAFCVSKLIERIILCRLLFFLESNFILSPCQAGFRLGRSTLDQILFFARSISDEFNKPRPGSLTILATIDPSKAFDSVWHPALSINSFRLTSLLALIVGLNLSFVIGALAWFI